MKFIYLYDRNERVNILVNNEPKQLRHYDMLITFTHMSLLSDSPAILDRLILVKLKLVVYM